MVALMQPMAPVSQRGWFSMQPPAVQAYAAAQLPQYEGDDDVVDDIRRCQAEIMAIDQQLAQQRSSDAQPTGSYIRLRTLERRTSQTSPSSASHAFGNLEVTEGSGSLQSSRTHSLQGQSLERRLSLPDQIRAQVQRQRAAGAGDAGPQVAQRHVPGQQFHPRPPGREKSSSAPGTVLRTPQSDVVYAGGFSGRSVAQPSGVSGWLTDSVPSASTHVLPEPPHAPRDTAAPPRRDGVQAAQVPAHPQQVLYPASSGGSYQFQTMRYQTAPAEAQHALPTREMAPSPTPSSLCCSPRALMMSPANIVRCRAPQEPAYCECPPSNDGDSECSLGATMTQGVDARAPPVEETPVATGQAVLTLQPEMQSELGRYVYPPTGAGRSQPPALQLKESGNVSPDSRPSRVRCQEQELGSPSGDQIAGSGSPSSPLSGGVDMWRGHFVSPTDSHHQMASPAGTGVYVFGQEFTPCREWTAVTFTGPDEQQHKRRSSLTSRRASIQGRRGSLNGGCGSPANKHRVSITTPKTRVQRPSQVQATAHRPDTPHPSNKYAGPSFSPVSGDGEGDDAEQDAALLCHSPRNLVSFLDIGVDGSAQGSSRYDSATDSGASGSPSRGRRKKKKGSGLQESVLARRTRGKGRAPAIDGQLLSATTVASLSTAGSPLSLSQHYDAVGAEVALNY
eukprot:TRINITY_DN6672_c0_g1_i2.p1 TRINITY_DN6672_c0_g1~~TRINITY_DN6672_c0_g1_i2.p1  ORF type:complete len:715 (+),score=120.28 TRINITY_DN6672_c0_g1_i2:119-2146(+)